MPIRAFGPVTLSGSAVPVFLATTLAAASPVPAPDPRAFGNSIEPGTNVPPVKLQVASSAKLRQGDRILVVNSDGMTNPENANVLTIVDSTHITVTAGKGFGLTVSHANGSLVIVDNDVASVRVQADSANAAVIYLGTGPSVTSTDPAMFYELAIAPATGELPELILDYSFMGDPIRTGQFWANGASGKIVPSYFRL